MQAPAGASLSDDATTRTEPARRTWLWAGLGVGVLAVDQVTKWWAESALTTAESRPFIGTILQLRLTYNPGAAFSLGAGYTIVLTLVAVAVVVVGVRMARRIRSTGWAVTLGLLLGGALGNVTDRLLREPGPLRGHVVDFLQLPNWPIFNVADVAITSAAALLVIQTLRGVRLDGTRESAS